MKDETTLSHSSLRESRRTRTRSNRLSNGLARATFTANDYNSCTMSLYSTAQPLPNYSFKLQHEILFGSVLVKKVKADLFHRCTNTAYLDHECLACYNVLITSRVHASIKSQSLRTNEIHRCGLVRRWNKCVKPLPVVVKVR